MKDFLAMMVFWTCVFMFATAPFWASTIDLVGFECDEATSCDE